MPETLERWAYGNPEEVAMRREAQSCKGCEQEVKERFFGQEVKRCQKDKRYGTRCNLYREKL